MQILPRARRSSAAYTAHYHSLHHLYPPPFSPHLYHTVSHLHTCSTTWISSPTSTLLHTCTFSFYASAMPHLRFVHLGHLRFFCFGDVLLRCLPPLGSACVAVCTTTGWVSSRFNKSVCLLSPHTTTSFWPHLVSVHTGFVSIRMDFSTCTTSRTNTSSIFYLATTMLGSTVLLYWFPCTTDHTPALSYVPPTGTSACLVYILGRILSP